MAKTPVLVTAAEWKKVKPVTLKDPGLDKKLAAWEAVKKNVTAKPTMAGLKSSSVALYDVVAMAKTTSAACNKTLHKDAIAFLAGYPAAVAKISQGLQKEGADLSKRIAAWNQARVDTLAGFKRLQPQGQQLAAKVDATMTQVQDPTADADAKKRNVRLAATVLKEVQAFRKDCQDTIDIIRIATDANKSLDPADRDQKYVNMFSQTIAIQSELEGLMVGREQTLKTFIKANM